MRLRRWTTIVALIGVLLHAGALVRHHGIMLGANLLEQAFADPAAICFGGQDSTSRSSVGHPAAPKPSEAHSECPVCAGQAPVFALAAPDATDVPVRFAVMARWFEPERANPALRHAVCPPPRGPPASAA
jgi:hypothetical protein